MATGFRDRAEAGRRLAAALRQYAGRPDALVLALPRGGVPVGYEVAAALGVPLRVVILVDDGLATGATMRAAAAALRAQHPARVVVAVPTAARETCDALRLEVDEVVCAETPPIFGSVGMWYEDFSETSDDEVRDLLGRAAA
jgi:predicted phosphoribosyltransferase